jgi:hypothetical protein
VFDTTPVADAGPAKTDAKPDARSSSGSTSSSSSSGSSGGGSGTCPSDLTGKKAEIKTEFEKAPPDGRGPWKPAATAQTKCTLAQAKTADAAIATYIAGASPTFKGVFDLIVSNSNQACAECVMSPIASANWGTFVTQVDGADFTAFSNDGAKYSAAGVANACAETLYYIDVCGDIACNPNDCTDEAATTACYQTVFGQGGTCITEYTSDIQANCPKAELDKVDAVDKKRTANRGTAGAAFKTTLGPSMAFDCGNGT